VTEIPKPPRRAPKPRKRIKPKGKKRTPKRRRSRLAMRRECDKRFAFAVKQRDGWACKACGDHLRGVQCAHVLSRRYHAVRWSMANAVALCAGCHMKFTHDPLAWDDWVTERFGDAVYMELKRIARQGVAHIDYELVLASLPEVK
jgi:5-methylcytosine-specific restriction endonuclease McrA